MRLIDRDIARRVWAIAWPLMVAEAINSVLSITDTFFVSRLGDEDIAAVGLGGYASWMFFVFNQLYYMGILVLVSQAYGAGSREEASRISGESVTAALLLAVPVVLVGFAVSKPFLRILGGSGSPYVPASEYFRIRLVGLIPASLVLSLGAVFRAVGETRPVLRATLVAVLVNIVLDPLLIFGIGPFPAMGVRGAAWASVASMIADLLLHVYYLGVIPFPLRPLPPGSRALMSARVGFPAMVERLVFAAGNMAYMGIVSRCGEASLAAHTIGMRIEAFAYMPAFALSVAASSMVGQEVGAGRVAEAKRVGWEVSKISVLFMVLVGALLIAVSPFAPRVFTETSEVARLSTIYLVLAGISEPSLGLIMSLAGSIRGAGNTAVPTLVNLAGLYAFRVAPAYLLAGIGVMGRCVVGAWLAMDLDIGIRSAVFLILYRSLFERIARKLIGSPGQE